MIRVVPWHDVPRPVRKAGFTFAAALALVVVLGLAAALLAALVLHAARVGGL